MKKTLKSSQKSSVVYFFKTIYHVISELGFNPLNTIAFIRSIPVYTYQFINFWIKTKKLKQVPPIGTPFPCMIDRYDSAGFYLSIIFIKIYGQLVKSIKIIQSIP